MNAQHDAKPHLKTMTESLADRQNASEDSERATGRKDRTVLASWQSGMDRALPKYLQPRVCKENDSTRASMHCPDRPRLASS